MQELPNVLLVVLDSVRARNTSLHGYDHETTPFLDSFASRATTYTQARAPGVASVPSHASIFTGLHVSEHRMRDVEKRLVSGSTIWEELKRDGYDTGVFSYNSYLTQSKIGFTGSFDTVKSGADQRLPNPEALDPDDLSSDGVGRYVEFFRRAFQDHPLKSLQNGLTMRTIGIDWIPASLRPVEDVDGAVFTDLFFDWIEGSDQPWACCLNYMDAHVPYLPRPEHNHWASDEAVALMREIDEHVWEFVAGRRPWDQRRQLEGLYDGCIRQLDSELERVVTGLGDRGLLSDTLLVITADHGEGFVERGEVRPARSLAHGNTGGVEEGLLHVPLVVSFPGRPESERVDAPATLTQFPELVRRVRNDSVDREALTPENGRVLASMLPMPDSERRTIPDSVDDPSVYVPGGEVVYAEHDDQVRKYVRWRSESATLDVSNGSDPRRLAADGAGVVTEAFDGLSQSDAVVDSTFEPGEEVEARLEELGYR